MNDYKKYLDSLPDITFDIDHAGCGCCSERLTLSNLKAWMELPEAPHD